MRKRPSNRLVLLIGALLVFPVTVRAHVAPADLSGITARLETEVEKFLTETGIPAISVALVKEGEVAWTGAYGYANVATRSPAAPDTYFSTGSTFKFVGEYELNPSFMITITREGARFFLQATNQPHLEIFASSETDFFLKAVEASVTFGRDDPAGPVTHMILHQGGDQRLKRRR